jgi:hypothetical protein
MKVFPDDSTYPFSHPEYDPVWGMTVRTAIAKSVMASIATNWNMISAKHAAVIAKEWADALIEELNK